MEWNFTKSRSFRFGGLISLWLILLFALPGYLSAQLSGTYAIGSGGDFLTFTEAVDSLASQGVSGAVIFNVLSGTYVEQLEISNISGASAANTIIFQSQSGNTSDVILTFPINASNNYLVKINGADYITFQNMTFTAAGTSYGRIFHLINNADNNSIINNILNGVSTTSTSINLV